MSHIPRGEKGQGLNKAKTPESKGKNGTKSLARGTQCVSRVEAMYKFPLELSRHVMGLRTRPVTWVDLATHLKKADGEGPRKVMNTDMSCHELRRVFDPIALNPPGSMSPDMRKTLRYKCTLMWLNYAGPPCPDDPDVMNTLNSVLSSQMGKAGPTSEQTLKDQCAKGWGTNES